MSTAVIAGFARTPFAFARKGVLAQTRPDDLAAVVLRSLTRGLDPALIDDVFMGCAYPEAEQGNNIARIAALLAGFPVSVPGMTMNRFCGSSMSAVHMAAGQIAMGAGEAFIAAGVESMSMVPQGGLNFSPNPRFVSPDHPDAPIGIEAYIPMGRTAENVAARHGVSRADQERFAFDSQMKAARAQAQGRLAGELAPVATPDGQHVVADQCLRPQTSLPGLAALRPAFDGTVTAGTASPLTDGAAGVLLTSEAFARRHGLDILARVKATAVAGCAPEFMGMGPVPASRLALARAGLAIEDIGVVELNEAFASQALACMRELGLDPERVNLDGGAIALGHPLGATGARITGKAAQLLRREGCRYALATQCIGGGQGIATVLEAV
ncbi:thiolase family protein [Bordetella pseudohinzii]|uniref:3-ketoacyl-CoA thiolase n=1 Tax=Bordetella pseudohinzii TaxID=1331258 RepID=A0A0J6F5A3_9BORD|nr:thiolase family protein [Bordetella pseudohinzii]ANY16459.1 acetyl-CoA acetyltransferase [Bordetella pseudohinzii]KMM27600.1 acetyl-CoA acetyltransferase [Bordetella pseudohinzii]KXA81575.1 acetyl-CoA acetyltransferase [Bordetella pseudohinzii]KXA82065.1 acetyl-CoA acetyltransferase [Bordetella pseudohinzii]CUI36303.1 3-ketoacyl-CoA thiolase [Bordetella pseudohinzii]